MPIEAPKYLELPSRKSESTMKKETKFSNYHDARLKLRISMVHKEKKKNICSYCGNADNVLTISHMLNENAYIILFTVV